MHKRLKPNQPAPTPERAFRLLDPWRERDACGVGFVARADGKRSPEILSMALTAVARLAHRGAASNDKSGDGAGVLTQIPHHLLGVGPVERVALGMFFLPPDGLDQAIDLIEGAIVSLGMSVLGWRVVPVDSGVLGPLAAASQPAIRQIFVGPPSGPANAHAWERRLYLARRVIERRAAAAALPLFACSLSCRTVVYKALLVGTELPHFYADLRSPLFETAIAVFHQRYSTNTLPSWPLAQPFRLLAHNGEINTLWGNRNAMLAREPALAAPVWNRDVELLKPVIWAEGSDSTSLDNAFELLVRSGRDPVHALMMLLPEAWERVPDMHPALRSFYEYHAGLMEPWDGPAALAFSDGVVAGSALDRNGLRPCRYKVTRDNVVVAGSEVGIVDLEPSDVVESGRLGPGELLVVDTLRNVVLRSADAKLEVAQRCPYRRWTARTVRQLPSEVAPRGPALPAEELNARQHMFGYSHEDLKLVISPMAAEGKDAIWSMGDDTPIPPLSKLPQNVYAYMRQRFAQVTNPAIDPLREESVMSLVMYLGRRGSLLAQRPAGKTLLRIAHPVMLAEEMAALRRVDGSDVTTLSATWEAAAGPTGLERALESLARDAVTAVRRGGGSTILVISDRDADRTRAPIPMLLAIGAVHQRLVHAKQRIRVGLVAEAGDAWDVHHIAALFGYGAEAVHPWLALQCLRDAESSAEKYRSAAEKGLLKILSKMGISTLQSYAGAQMFESIGLGAEVIDRCFTGTASVIGGIGFREIAEDVLSRHGGAG
ncbi:MAG TPA: glutamate synthase central domain-containing protein, partial [Gemmatimonadales bacterium]|nr:glutamate synthase central domain-containing protein [Gemmatimonadales bacterium]